jgi:hypothetical protein
MLRRLAKMAGADLPEPREEKAALARETRQLAGEQSEFAREQRQFAYQ